MVNRDGDGGLGCSERSVNDARATASSGCVDGYAFTVPEELGEGTMRTVAACDGICVSEHRYVFDRSLHGSGPADPTSVDLYFCRGQGVGWERFGGGEARSFELAGGEALATAAAKGVERVCYRRKVPYDFVAVKLSRAALDRLALSALDDADRARVERALRAGATAPLTPASLLALHEMTNCPYSGPLARMHAEGKLLELLAALLAESVLDRPTPSARLSRTDRAAVEQARRILDARLADPPTYPELAREVLVSETKLSRGFKEAFGMSLHAYVVERRLETARLLLAGGESTVSEAACAVGYGNLGHFSAAFRKRYGVLPSALARSAGRR